MTFLLCFFPASLSDRLDYGIERGAGPHCLINLIFIGVIVAAHIYRLALRTDQLRVDLFLILSQLLGNGSELRLQLRVLGLLGKSLSPIKSKVEVAPAVIDLADFAGGR